MKNYWRDYPPAYLLLRALAGFRPPRQAEAAPFDALAALAPTGTLNLAALPRR